jgi:hypothetical protein
VLALGYAAPSGYALGQTPVDKTQVNAEQTATSTGGIVVHGYAGGVVNGHTSYGWQVNNASWQVNFVAPSGTSIGSGPLRAGDPALRKTWVTVDEDQGGTNWGGNFVSCAFANPADASVTSGGSWDLHVSFQVSCPNDGLGYQYYRIYLDDNPSPGWRFDTSSWDAGLGQENQFGTGGDGNDAQGYGWTNFNRVVEAEGLQRRSDAGYTKVCGYTASGSSTCWSYDQVYGGTMDDQSYGGSASIYYADSFTALEFADPI